MQNPPRARSGRCCWLDPAQRSRLAEIRDNLTERIAEAEREGWKGEAEGLLVSLSAAEDKLAQIDAAAERKVMLKIKPRETGIPVSTTLDAPQRYIATL